MEASIEFIWDRTKLISRYQVYGSIGGYILSIYKHAPLLHLLKHCQISLKAAYGFEHFC